MPRKSLTSLFRSPILKIGAILLIVAAIPLTVFISQQQQDIRQRASEINPLTAHVSGPTTGQIGQPLSYNAGASSSTNVSSVSIHWAKKDADLTQGSSWTQIAKTDNCTAYFASGLGECPVEGTFTPSETGSYYISIVSVGEVGPCSGNPQYASIPGWSDCGPNDLIELTIAAPITPAPTLTGSISGPTTGTVGQRLAYAARGDSQPGGAKFVTMHVAKTTADLTLASSWTKIGEQEASCGGAYASGLSYCPASGSFTPVEAGTYYVTVVVVPESGSPCSGNPRYNAIPGWLDCGLNDAITLTVSPSSSAGGTLFYFTVNLTGIGERGNKNPRTTQKELIVEFFDTNDMAVATTSGQIVFDAPSNSFIGNVATGSDMATGNYTVKVHTTRYLKKRLPGIQTITGISITPSPITLTVGDANDDNKLDITDYNMLISCFGDKANTTSCIDKDSVDFDDNNIIDGVDYNLFVRSLSIKEGD